VLGFCKLSDGTLWTGLGTPGGVGLRDFLAMEHGQLYDYETRYLTAEKELSSATSLASKFTIYILYHFYLHFLERLGESLKPVIFNNEIIIA
jgi:hypothetical protein